MSDSDVLHEVDSVDEAISVGAEELGVDEDDLRERIESIELCETTASSDDSATVRRQTD